MKTKSNKVECPLVSLKWEHHDAKEMTYISEEFTTGEFNLIKDFKEDSCLSVHLYIGPFDKKIQGHFYSARIKKDFDGCRIVEGKAATKEIAQENLIKELKSFCSKLSKTLKCFA